MYVRDLTPGIISPARVFINISPRVYMSYVNFLLLMQQNVANILFYFIVLVQHYVAEISSFQTSLKTSYIDIKRPINETEFFTDQTINFPGNSENTPNLLEK